MQGCGIIVKEVAFLDHVVPLLQIMGFPLLVCDPYLKELTEIYYPGVEVIVAKDYCLDSQLERFDTYIYSEFYRRPTGYFQFGDFYSRRNVSSLFLFHGMGEKHGDLFWMEQLASEDGVLIYGPQFYEKLKEKNILGRINRLIFCGNYRAALYQGKAEPSGNCRAALNQEKVEPKGVLYAPTWTSPVQHSGRSRHYSTVLEDFEHVMRELEDFDVTVKLHPYFEELYPKEARQMQKSFVPPPIFPLLDRTEILITDHSSIAYDFLHFKRPIFLFGEERPWAERVTHETLRTKVQSAICHKEEQEKAYQHAFGEFKDPEELKAELLRAY